MRSFYSKRKRDKNFAYFSRSLASHTKQLLSFVLYAKRVSYAQLISLAEHTSVFLSLVSLLRKTKKRYVLVSFFLHNLRRKDIRILSFPLKSSSYLLIFLSSYLLIFLSSYLFFLRDTKSIGYQT